MKALHFWMLPDHGSKTASNARGHLREFIRMHPEIKVEVAVKTASSLWKQLFLILKRPQEVPAPDLIEIPAPWGSTLEQLGMLEGPSVPWWTEIGVLYYRKDLLRRHGLDPAEALASIGGLMETCRRLARVGGRCLPIANGNSRDFVSMEDVAPWVWSRGGDFFSRDGSRALFHREEAFYGIHEYLQLLDQGWMPLLGKNGLVPVSLFEGGSFLQFHGRLPPRCPFPLGAVVFPRGDGGRRGTLSARHLAVPRASALGPESSELLRYLTRPSQAERYAASVGGFPCRQEQQEASFQGAGEELGGVFREAKAHARALPEVPFLGTLEKVFDRSMENLIRTILQRSYCESVLRQELIYAAAEMDYVLSLAGAAA